MAEDQQPSANGRRRGTARRLVVPAALAGAGTLAFRTRSRRRQAYPPGPDALRPEDARARAEALLSLPRVMRRDLALQFAPAAETIVEPLLHGRRYFPRMLEDLAAARDHIHLLMYGYKDGEIGRRFLDVLAARAAAGVDVRLSVDAIGSEIDGSSRRLYRDLQAAGIRIVANDALLPLRTGALGSRRLTTRASDFFHFDHRKMAVIDGRVGYIGGSGIEDHYTDERFYDVMCRVTGPLVPQLALVFLGTWLHHGGRFDPADLDRAFPEAGDAAGGSGPDEDGSIRAATTILANVPGTGHHPISDAIESLVASAQDRIDIVNPYISNRRILAELLAAAGRGVRIRLIAPGRPTPPYPAAAFRHAYGGLMAAGVEIVLHPEMAHAKVLRIDGRVLVGGCNLDDLSLFRNDELDILVDHPRAGEVFDAAVFDELVAMSAPAAASTGWRTRTWEAAMSRVSRLL